MKNKINKKASSQVGIAIIIMAILLLVGGIFLDDTNSNSKSSYFKSKNNQNSNNQDYPEDYYLFYLNETNIGTQKKVTQNFPNIELGSTPKPNIVFLGNNFILNANPFTKNSYTINVDFSEPENVNEYLIYMSPNRKNGNAELIIKVDGVQISKNLAKSSDLPIRVYKNPTTNRSTQITFELEKPKWYEIFSWNKFEVNELRVVEVIQNKNNNNRRFDFEIDRLNLERIYIELAIKCQEIKELSEAIEIKVNGNVISNQNPDCRSRYNRITAQIPATILKEPGMNTVELKTNGFYTVGYSLNKVYYNDKDIYKFNINSFNDILDVVIYGDYNKDVIDLKLNKHIFSLNRDEIKSVIPYLKFGTNELEIMTKPLEIKELVVEKSEFLY